MLFRSELCGVKGIGRDKAVTLKAAFTLARRMATEIRAGRPLLDSPERISDWLREDFRATGVERLVVLLLDTRRRLIRVEELAHGTLNEIHVHAREVFRAAIAANAAAIALAHNHPSGDPTPSDADIKVTRDLIRAGQVLKIEVLDHVILADERYYSLAEAGRLPRHAG